jgi:hypothetical protein
MEGKSSRHVGGLNFHQSVAQFSKQLYFISPKAYNFVRISLGKELFPNKRTIRHWRSKSRKEEQDTTEQKLELLDVDLEEEQSPKNIESELLSSADEMCMIQEIINDPSTTETPFDVFAEKSKKMCQNLEADNSLSSEIFIKSEETEKSIIAETKLNDPVKLERLEDDFEAEEYKLCDVRQEELEKYFLPET